MTSFQIYGDFNCPFCYALEERLRLYEGSYDIKWRPIQHVPNEMNLQSVEDMAQMASEVYTVRHRAPEVSIAMPQLRPNSAVANMILMALEAKNYSLAQKFRSRVFEALWMEGLDISDQEVVAKLLLEQGLEMPEFGLDGKTELVEIQQQWQAADPDRRIPILTASDGRTLIGLSSPRDIDCFLEGRESAGEPSGVCEFVPLPVILVIGHPSSMWHLIDGLQSKVDLLVAGDCTWALKLVEDGLKPDLLLLSSTQDNEALRNCAALQQASLTADVPIMIVDQSSDPERELQFLQMGASVYFQAGADPNLFHARMQVHLVNKTRRDYLQQTVRLDPLTRIPNRRELERVLEVEWRRGVYSKFPLTVALFDVDHFKNYNDTYGHQAGDNCLIQLTTALRGALRRESDFVARYGGEEFVLVLPDCTEIGGQEIAESCRRAVQMLDIPHSSSPTAAFVTVSVGLTTIIPTLATNLRSVLNAADKALYQSKSAGRNCIQWLGVEQANSVDESVDVS
jgi:diguanylate cyclase (GGDEF)-like protein